MIKEFWIGLLIGLIIGWVIEWIVDRVYWRKRYQQYEQQLEETKDKLRDIKGVGKALEKRLNEAGIYSFLAFAELSKTELEMIAGDVKDITDFQNLIKQAKKLAKKKKKNG